MPPPATLSVFDQPRHQNSDRGPVQALGTFERGLRNTDICLRQVSVMVQKLELHRHNPNFSGNLSVDKEMLINYVVKGH